MRIRGYSILSARVAVRVTTQTARVVARATVSVAVAVAIAAGLGSCLDKSTPEPDFDGIILAFEVEGQIGCAINEPSRTVDVVLDEAADINAVRVSKITLNEGASCGLAEGDVIDLSEPRKVIIETVSGYEWMISATQNINYRFEVENQVGATSFELHSNSAFAHVPVGTDMTKIKILSLKLSPEGIPATLSPAIEAGDIVAFRRTGESGTQMRDVEVSYRGTTRTWHLYVTETDVQLDKVDVFARRVYLSGFGQPGSDNGFEYRLATASEWTRVPQSMMAVGDDGTFTATLTGLEKETAYAVRAFSGESLSDIHEFATQGERALPGGGFEEWHQGPDSRREGTIATISAWNPWPEGGVWEVGRWWDSGNRGVAIVDHSSGGNSLRTNMGEGSPANHSGRAARLETKWAVVKAAGGNIYFGEFGEMGGLDATCHIGHPWQHKPTGLKGWFKYIPQPIDEVSESHRKLHPYGLTTEQWMGSPDSLHVCVALWSSPDGRNVPFTVNSDTTPASAFVDFGRDKPGVIAYGAFVSAERQDEWKEFTIDMDYFDTGELPANTQLYLLVTASKNCNYFIAGTGRKTGMGSVMYVDELELVYD